jgi:hypothetical protein
MEMLGICVYEAFSTSVVIRASGLLDCAVGQNISGEVDMRSIYPS